MRHYCLNTRMTKLPAVLTLALWVAPDLRADELSFNTLYRSPYYLGHGDAGLATAENAEAIFYNPAGLATGKGIYRQIILVSPTIEASAQAKDLARQAFIEGENNTDTFRNFLGNNIHFGLSNVTAVVFRRVAIGALVNTNTNVMVAKSAEDRGIEGIKADLVANRAVTFSLADTFWKERIQIGTTLKFIMRNEAQISSSILDSANIQDQLQADSALKERRGLGVDLGLIYNFDKSPWKLGLHMENAGTTYLRSTEADTSPRRLPQIVSIGGAYEVTTKMDKLRVLFDFRDLSGHLEKSVVKRLHLGTEMTIARLIGLSAGLNQGYPTAGMFVNLYVLRADVGTYTQEIGSAAGIRADQRYFLRLTLGF